MKNVTGPTYADRIDQKLDLWAAEIELANVRFSRSADTAIEFSNEIDVWSKMEFRFRQQIKRLRSGGQSELTSELKKDFSDLGSLIYSIRERLD